MLHNNIDSVVTQPVLLNAKFLQSIVVLEHLTKVNCYRLTDCLVYWVVNVQLFQGVVR